MSSYTDLSLCSQALLKIGASTIDSYEDGTAESAISANLYPLVRDSLLSSYPWSFALAQTSLNRLSNSPLADYKYAYQLPLDLLRIISAGRGARGKGITYRVAENTLHTNAEAVVLTYIFRPQEANFPAFFADALVAKLAAEFCLPLTESTSRSEYLSKLCDESFAKARLTDAQQDTPQCFEDFTLVEARQ